jgi:hypothetical protein
MEIIMNKHGNNRANNHGNNREMIMETRETILEIIAK